MKKGLIVIVIVMLAGGLVYPLLKGSSGYILIAYKHTTIEMSIWTGLLLLIFVVLVLRLLWRMFSGGRRMANFFSSGRERASVRAQRHTMAALVDFMAGNWRAASKVFIQNADKSPNPLVNYLAAARCVYELGDIEGALELLHQAEVDESNKGENNYEVALIQAHMLFDNERYEQSLAILNRIKLLLPEHSGMLNLLVDVYWMLEDYDGLQILLPALERYKVRTKAEIEQLEVDLLKKRLNIVDSAAIASSEEEAKQILDKLWQQSSPKLQKAPKAMTTYATQLHLLGNEAEAESWLLKSIKKQWSTDAVELFGCIESGNAASQLQTATHWLSDHMNDSVLLCALGRISVRNELWGKARDYFQQSIKINPEPEVYAELAQLLQQLGEYDASNAVYKEGLYSVFDAQPRLS